MVGKGLGGLDEKALVYHASNYKLDKEESLMSYIVTCFAGHIVQEMTENTQLSELNALLYEEEPEVPQSFPCRIIWSWTAAPGSTLPPLWDATGNGVWIRMLWIRSLRKRFIGWQNYTEDCKVCRVA